MALRTRLQSLSWQGSCSHGGRGIHLGRFWSNEITRKEGHRVIDTGPYGLVRHPIYTGLIAAILATGLAVGTATAILGAVLISFGLSVKARAEESFLTSELDPSAY